MNSIMIAYTGVRKWDEIDFGLGLMTMLMLMIDEDEAHRIDKSGLNVDFWVSWLRWYITLNEYGLGLQLACVS